MQVVIVGGGAAGCMAAGAAARRGHTVTVVERNARPARKVMITGKGRCNVTNHCTPQQVLETIRNMVPQDTIVATDVGQHQMWTIQHFHFD